MDDLAKYVFVKAKASLRKKVEVKYEEKEEEEVKERGVELREKVSRQMGEIERMRGMQSAPVDSMGCDLHTCPDSTRND